MEAKKKQSGPLSSLFEQAANISKAHGYDILSEQVKELLQENTALKERISVLEDENKRLIDALKMITDTTANLWDGVKSNSAADRQVSKVWEIASKALISVNFE